MAAAAAAERCGRDPCGALCPLLAYLSVGYADYAVLAHVLPQPALRARCPGERPGLSVGALWALWGGQQGLWGLSRGMGPVGPMPGCGACGGTGTPPLSGSRLPGGAQPHGILQWGCGVCGDALSVPVGCLGFPTRVRGSCRAHGVPVGSMGCRAPGFSPGCRVLSWLGGALWLWGPHGARGPWGTASMGSLWGSGPTGGAVSMGSTRLWVHGVPGALGLWDPRSDLCLWGTDCAGPLWGSGCWGSPCAPHPPAHGAPSTQ